MIDNYSRLYDAWRREKQRIDIQPLQENFHAAIAEYITQLREQTKTADKSTLAGKIMEKEKEHVERMIGEINQVRMRKIVILEVEEKPVDVLNLTAEEKRLQVELRRLLAAHSQGIKHVLVVREYKTEITLPQNTQPQTQPQQTTQPPQQKPQQAFKVIRFTQTIPAIMGVDMMTYGPFKAEDIASLPAPNAENLIRKGIAKEVEISP
jgi:DNA replication factor GINS